MMDRKISRKVVLKWKRNDDMEYNLLKWKNNVDIGYNVEVEAWF